MHGSGARGIAFSQAEKRHNFTAGQAAKQQPTPFGRRNGGFARHQGPAREDNVRPHPRGPRRRAREVWGASWRKPLDGLGRDVDEELRDALDFLVIAIWRHRADAGA